MTDSASMKIFSGSSNPQLAKEIAAHLGADLAPIEIKKFSDQEISIKILDNVRGADVFIVQSTCYPANDNIIELCLIMDAFRRASVKRINVVIPYFGYGRQDRKVEPRVPISAKVISSLIERGGANRLICMDLHADQIQGFFDIPVDHLYSAPILIDYFQSLALSNLVIVSPDSGGAERARFFAKHLDATLAIIDKRRERPNEAAVMNIVGNVEGKNCIVIDDMIDTAGTICKGADALRKAGAKSVIAGATHGVLSGAAMDNLTAANFDQLVITNTIPISAAKRMANMKILSVAPLMGEAIVRIHEERSVSSLFL